MRGKQSLYLSEDFSKKIIYYEGFQTYIKIEEISVVRAH